VKEVYNRKPFADLLLFCYYEREAKMG